MATGIKRLGAPGTAAVYEELKAGASRLVLEEGKTIGAVRRELDFTASALSQWVKQAQAERTKGKIGLMKEEREELARLRKEVRILAEERDIPKEPRPSSPSTMSAELRELSTAVPYDERLPRRRL
jgi:transposase